MFRVYDKKRKIFITEDVLMNKNGDLYMVGKKLFRNKFTFLHQDRYIFQQTTGLFDRNNIEIYIGDVLEAEVADDRTVRGIVVYASELASYVILCFDSDEYFVLGESVCGFIEVIGNVFDNEMGNKDGDESN